MNNKNLIDNINSNRKDDDSVVGYGIYDVPHGRRFQIDHVYSTDTSIGCFGTSTSAVPYRALPNTEILRSNINCFLSVAIGIISASFAVSSGIMG